MAKRKINKPADWDWLTASPDSQINPPTVTRVQELDFGALTWENFEKLCYRLALLEADVEHCQLYGVRGQSQKGIDIYARLKSDGSFTVYQCKRENNFTAGKIINAVDTFRAGTWAKKAKRFVLCTKESLIETQLADEIETQREVLKQEKVSFALWGNIQLSEKLRDLPELVDEFFGREWVRVFCGGEAAARLGEKFDQAVFDDYLRAVKRFSADTPYLALNETLTGKKLLLNEIYVPFPFNAPEVSQNKVKSPTADARAGENSDADDGKTSSVSTLADVLSYAAESGKPVLLQGTGGAGKSTVLYRVAHDAWDNPAAIGLPAPLLPIVVRLPVLAAVKEFSLPKLLLQSLRDGNDLTLNGDLPENFIDSWSRRLNAKWLVMLDGLDEVAAERRPDALQRLKHLISVLTESGHLAVVTSRPASDEEFRRLSEKSVVADLLSFDEAQRKDFAVRWFGDRADDFLEKVGRFVKSGNLFREPLALTPLLLTIAAAVYETQGDLPEAGENELYREFINVLFQKAEQRGLKDELREEVFDVARFALEELALAMTDQPEENTFNDLEKVCANFLRQTLGYNAVRAQRPAHDLCEVLTRRSGVLFKQGETCQWVHATMREYLAAVALDRQIKDGSGDYETTVGARIGETKNDELLITFGRIHDDERALISWLTEKAQTEKSAKAAVFAYDIWDESEAQTQNELHREIILALSCGFGDADSSSHLRDVSKNLLVEMGERAVEPLLHLLDEMNGVQEKLLPEWDAPRERPDIYDEPGRQIYQADRIRQKIIIILGEIGDERAIEPLVSLLPQQSRFDSYRYYVAQTARRALRCIGKQPIAPIVARVTDSGNSTKDRCDYFAGVTSIGIRTDKVSETVRKCLTEGLTGDKELLNYSIWAAANLRDRSQARLVEQALASSDDLDTLDQAAWYFTVMPNESATAELETAFQKCLSRPEEKPNWSSWTIKKLAGALLASGQKQARNSVLEFIKSNLSGNDKISAHAVVKILGDSNLPEAPEILLRELARRLESPAEEKSDGIIGSLLREIVQIWRPEMLERLTSVAAELLNKSSEEKNFADRLIEIHSEPPRVGEDKALPLRSRVSFEIVLKTLAKCRIPNFGAAVSRLLPVSVWSSTMETCDALWLAGSPAAEEALIDKLHQLTTTRKTKENRKDDETPGTDEYYVIRALGTCAVSERGVETVLEYMREDPRLSINLPYDVLRTLLRRDAVKLERIAEIALDRTGTHDYARDFCLQALGSFNAPLSTRVFLDAFLNETYESARAFAAHALGWPDEANRAEAISALEDQLTKTTSARMAMDIGQSLVRLKSTGSLPLIEEAVKRFGVDKMLDLLASAAEFRAASTFEMLPDIFNEKWHYSDRKEQNIAAFGFYYQKEERARANVRAQFEASFKGQDTGKQRHAVYALAVHDPVWLLQRATEMFDGKILEASAKRAIISRAGQISNHKSCDTESFTRLYVRFLCDQDLTIRESAAASLTNINSKLRQRIYDALYAFNHDWARACAIYSLGFWDSDETEIECARFDVSKTVRFSASVAKSIRDKRAALKKTIHAFKESSGGSERVTAYFALAEQAEMSHVETLYRSISYEHPAYLFLHDLEKDVEKRVKTERKKRAKDEEESLCQSARSFAALFS